MPDWSQLAVNANAVMLRTFGETVTYSPLAGDPPATMRAVRGTRNPLESDALASFERLWAPSSAYPAPPTQGDEISIGTGNYIVHSVKADSDAGDGITVYLARKP